MFGYLTADLSSCPSPRRRPCSRLQPMYEAAAAARPTSAGALCNPGMRPSDWRDSPRRPCVFVRSPSPRRHLPDDMTGFKLDPRPRIFVRALGPPLLPWRYPPSRSPAPRFRAGFGTFPPPPAFFNRIRIRSPLLHRDSAVSAGCHGNAFIPESIVPPRPGFSTTPHPGLSPA